MSNKKKFTIVGAVLVSILSFLPVESFSASANNNAENDDIAGLYIAGQYRPGISNFTGFGAKEANVVTQKLLTVKKDASGGLESILKSSSNFSEPYIAKFQDNMVSFSGVIGYSYPEGLRLEVEGSYEKFDVKDPKNCSVKDAFRHLALARVVDSGHAKDKKYTVMRNDGLSITSVLINGCYDFTFDGLMVSPYVCLGIGGRFYRIFLTLCMLSLLIKVN
ncbi:MAG: P44/Msp2 family outer membrane protein [Ehrlichia sp.]